MAFQEPPGPAIVGQRAPLHDMPAMSGGALVEQAKGALIFRYSIDAATALCLLELWAAQAGVDTVAVSYALVHDICQGDPRSRSEAGLVAWLAEQLRRDAPDVSLAVTAGTRSVAVDVDQSYTALDAVVAGAREAARLGVPLEITYADGAAGLPRAHQMQRVDLAVELARAVEPGLDVRLLARPTDKALAGE